MGQKRFKLLNISRENDEPSSEEKLDYVDHM